MTDRDCPICSQPVAIRHGSRSFADTWDCPRCGNFKIELLDQRMWEQHRCFAYKISAAIREQNRARKTPYITLEFVERAIGEPDKSYSEKLRLVLELIDQRMTYVGEMIHVVPSIDYPLVNAKHGAEFSALCGMHRDMNNFVWTTDGTTYSVLVSANGLETLEAMRRTRPDADSAFVAMWFDGVMDPIYLQQISPAIQEAGYRPVKIDLVPHNGDVIARIMTEIRLAKFVVADFTRHRNGVYFEAGFAKGIGMEVVWLCREDEMGKAHFDTNHFNHLTWKDDGKLKEHLAARILATIGPGPHYAKSPSVT